MVPKNNCLQLFVAAPWSGTEGHSASENAAMVSRLTDGIQNESKYLYCVKKAVQTVERRDQTRTLWALRNVWAAGKQN
jgi:hypothetical protein